MSDVPATTLHGSDLAAPFASPTPGKNKRERPEMSQSAKSNKEQKKKLIKPELALIESASSNSSASNKADHLVPMVSGVNGEKSFASVQGTCGSAMERVKEVQVKLPEEHPSFVKYMLQSHVIRGFSLGLPRDFCNKHLLKYDTTIVLEDEDGCNYHTKYLTTKQGLSAGWKGFAISHGIKLGDVVVFQLVSSTKFKKKKVEISSLKEWIMEKCGIVHLHSKSLTTIRDRRTPSGIYQSMTSACQAAGYQSYLSEPLLISPESIVFLWCEH